MDHNLDDNTRIACITADGYGYGADGKAWGGEILVGSHSEFQRMGGLDSKRYPGGDLAARYPVRPLIGILGDVLDLPEILDISKMSYISSNTPVSEEALSLLLEAKNQELNTVESTSAGRFLDVVSLILGICSENSYDGECPMKLESISQETDIRLKSKFISNEYGECLDIKSSILEILDLKRKGVSISEIAYASQWHLGDALAEIASRVAHDNELKYVGFSGGVALNSIMTKAIISRVNQEDLKILLHHQIPPGDGGISAGQVAVAASQIVQN